MLTVSTASGFRRRSFRSRGWGCPAAEAEAQLGQPLSRFLGRCGGVRVAVRTKGVKKTGKPAWEGPEQLHGGGGGGAGGRRSKARARAAQAEAATPHTPLGASCTRTSPPHRPTRADLGALVGGPDMAVPWPKLRAGGRGGSMGDLSAPPRRTGALLPSPEASAGAGGRTSSPTCRPRVWACLQCAKATSRRGCPPNGRAPRQRTRGPRQGSTCWYRHCCKIFTFSPQQPGWQEGWHCPPRCAPAPRPRRLPAAP